MTEKQETKSKFVEMLKSNIDNTSGFQYANQLRKIEMCEFILKIAKGHTRQWVVSETNLRFGQTDGGKLVNELIDRLIKYGDLNAPKKVE